LADLTSDIDFIDEPEPEGESGFCDKRTDGSAAPWKSFSETGVDCKLLSE
jgi:hypothetical protein